MNKQIISVAAIVVLMTIAVFMVAPSTIVRQTIASPAISTRKPASRHLQWAKSGQMSQVFTAKAGTPGRRERRVFSALSAPSAVNPRLVGLRRSFASVLPSKVAYFKVGFPTDDVTFTIMLTDTEKIKEARDIASGVQTDTVSVMGTIVKMPAPYNPGWGYHLAPESIQFFDVAVEVCDAHPYYVEEHLDEACGAFLPGCVWCPFSSRVIAKVRISEIFLPLVVVDGLAEENVLDSLERRFIDGVQVNQ